MEADPTRAHVRWTQFVATAHAIARFDPDPNKSLVRVSDAKHDLATIESAIAVLETIKRDLARLVARLAEERD
jgi:hypothetical protein